MSSWGKARRNRIILIFSITVLIIAGIFSYLYFNQPATCFDGKQNQGEYGIDCGGPCLKMCRGQVVDPLVHWTRHFEVVPGIYNVLTYMENLNTNAGTDKVDYVFKLHDENNVVLAERTGSIKIRPNEVIPIMEGTLNTGKLSASRVTFTILNEPVWYKRESRVRSLDIRNERLFEVDNLPRISAVLENLSVRRVNDISVVVIVYDTDDNAMTVSRTSVDFLNSEQTRDLVYTWPQRFPRSVGRFEIIPLYESP